LPNPIPVTRKNRRSTAAIHGGFFNIAAINPDLMKRTILMLEHDEDDRYVTQAYFDEQQFDVTIIFVSNSQEFFDHLSRAGLLPSLILLNYHTYPQSAADILRELKSNPKVAHIPVVVLSGSVRTDIIRQCYADGASSFIQKPSGSEETSAKIGNFIRYWFKTVELP
jgi:CheY-like chemotaxis protein